MYLLRNYVHFNLPAPFLIWLVPVFLLVLRTLAFSFSVIFDSLVTFLFGSGVGLLGVYLGGVGVRGGLNEIKVELDSSSSGG